jgi:hypothetical protein
MSFGEKNMERRTSKKRGGWRGHAIKRWKEESYLYTEKF